jgi:predicted DNA-binding antitoxin AbrB/MazE fold protein
MSLTVEATYENGVLRLDAPLPLAENQRITITIHETAGPGQQGYGLVRWTGPVEELDLLIEGDDNDPLEGP